MAGVKQVPGRRSPYAPRTPLASIGFTVGVEGGNVIKVTLQAKDYNGANLAVRGCYYIYLSDDANGDSIIAVAPSGTVVIAVNGLLNVLEAKKQFMVTTEANGLADINITEAGVKTLYVIARLPDGTLLASTAVTFA